MVLETTYGDRDRADLDEAGRQAVLRAEVSTALAAGGVLLIPVFAVERTQELLYDLDCLFDGGQLPAVDVFLDSPLADAVTGVFRRHLDDLETDGDPFTRANFHHVRSVPESQRLNTLSGGAIIMAASGMCDAGRVRKHLKRLLWRRDATVLLSGYQVAGTLGRILQEGARRVTIQGEDVQVRARIRALDVYSGHADAAGLTAWAEARKPVHGEVFVAHGEPAGRRALSARLVEAGLAGAHIRLPAMDESFVLRPGGADALGAAARRIRPEAAAAPDWHNARARLLLELNQRLDALPDDAARARLLADVAAALDEEPLTSVKA
jgi:metallo-beta-lactamase family protein